MEAGADNGSPVRTGLTNVPFYTTLSVKAPDRDDEIKRLKEAGPGRIPRSSDSFFRIGSAECAAGHSGTGPVSRKYLPCPVNSRC